RPEESTMDFGVLIEVAIGLAALYFLLAIACSFVVEAFHSYANVRGRALELFVREMIVGARRIDPPGVLGRLWAALTGRAPRPERTGFDLSILAHPLVRALQKPTTDMQGENTPPSYIPSELFAKALLDRVGSLLAPLSVPRNALASAAAAIDAIVPVAGAPTPGLTALRDALAHALADNNAADVNLAAVAHRLLDAFAATPQLYNALMGELATLMPQGVTREVDLLVHGLQQAQRQTGAAPTTANDGLTFALGFVAARRPSQPLTFNDLSRVIDDGH